MFRLGDSGQKYRCRFRESYGHADFVRCGPLPMPDHSAPAALPHHILPLTLTAACSLRAPAQSQSTPLARRTFSDLSPAALGSGGLPRVDNPIVELYRVL